MAKDKETGFSGISKLISEVEESVKGTIEEAISTEIPKLEKMVKDAEQRIKENQPLVVQYDGKLNEVKGIRHESLDMLILVASQRQPVLLVGMAGTGKTHAAAQVAESLGLEHYTMSVGAQTSKSDIMGYMHASGGYVPTMFRKAYEEGGVFLMDEIDAGNANVLIQVNAALSNGLCAFPDKMVPKHKDFIFIASANTFGNGQNRIYVGRNQLDAATLDRFTTIVWNTDRKMEKALVGNYKAGEKWFNVVSKIREKVENDGLRILVTPRATIKGAQLLEMDIEFGNVLDMVILESVPTDKKEVLRNVGLDAWGKEEPDAPQEEKVPAEAEEGEIVW